MAETFLRARIQSEEPDEIKEDDHIEDVGNLAKQHLSSHLIAFYYYDIIKIQNFMCSPWQH